MCSNLNFDIAHEVFGISEDTLDNWLWPIPDFAETRNDAMRVVCKMWSKKHLRLLFESNLEAAAKRLGWKKKPEQAGIATLMMVLTPDEICKAALITCRSNKDEVAL